MCKILKIYGLLIFFSISLLFSSVFVLNVRPAIADGIGIGIDGEIIPEMAQKAVIVWDEDDNTEILVLNASFGIDSLSNFCWIIPIQSEEDPDVQASDSEVFDYLEDMFPVNVRTDWNQYSASHGYGSSSAGIEVIGIEKIGVYELATIWADDADILAEWLEENGYEISNKIEDKIDYYIDKYDECYFIANKINMENAFSGLLNALKDYRPGIYNYLMAEELELKDVDTVIDNLKYAIVQDIMDDKPYGSNSFTGQIIGENDYEDLVDDWKDDDISLPKLNDATEEYLLESELFETIYKLFEGAGTPIQITFYPDNPTYPAYISSLASNFGGIDVYFISPFEIVDENNILTRWAYAELTSTIESDLEEMLDITIPSEDIYIIQLIYRGYMDDIDDDSVFIKYSQGSGTTPTYPTYPSYYPYSPIINPYAYSMPYSYSMFPSYNLPTLFGGFSYNRPFGGGGFLGSYFGSMGGLYGTSFGGLYGGGYNWPFGSSLYSGFPGTFGGLYGKSYFPTYSSTFGGLGLYGSSFFPGSTSIYGGVYGSSYFPSYSRWPF